MEKCIYTVGTSIYTFFVKKLYWGEVLNDKERKARELPEEISRTF